MLFHTREGTYVIGLGTGSTLQERPSYCNLMLHSSIKPLHTNIIDGHQDQSSQKHLLRQTHILHAVVSLSELLRAR
jgi:hypothetical protein